MTERRLSTLHEAATHLLDTLLSGRPVTLEITAQDAATGALLHLITAIHEAATARRVAIELRPVGAAGLRLRLSGP